MVVKSLRQTELERELKEEKAALSAVRQAATLYNYSREHEDRIAELVAELESIKSRSK